MDNIKQIISKKTYLKINVVKLSFYVFLLTVIFMAIYSTIPLMKAITVAFVISYLLDPLIIFFERKHIRRGWGISFIFIVLIIALVFMLFFFKTYFPSPEKINQIKNTIIVNLNNFKALLILKYGFIGWEDVFSTIQTNINTSSNVTASLYKVFSGVAGTSSSIMITMFCVFFFLLNGSEIKKGILYLIPNRYFEISYITLREVDDIFGKYIRGTIVESIIIGILTSIGLYIIGFPLMTSILTGIFAGVTNAIPYVGPLFGAGLGLGIFIFGLIPSDFVSIFTLKASVVSILLVFFIVQLFDNIILKPTVIGKSVNLHPLVVILAVMAGSNLFGFIGMLVAIPVVAIIKVVTGTLYKQLKGFQFLSDNLLSIVSREVVEED